MAKSHAGMPKPGPLTFNKSALLSDLLAVDQDTSARARVLAMEVDFRQRITQHVQGLPATDARFSKFNTNPFVLLIYSLQKAYRHISQIESAILPAKVFSSMETSAGRMVETVVLPVYGWEVVPSAMHSANSVLDGRRLEGNILKLATLKSGPRCLNDEMSENIADAILSNHQAWAQEAGVTEIDFTYGVLYGTKRISNKKDWHILRKIAEKLADGVVTISPEGRWHCQFQKDGVTVTVTIRIGVDLWNYIGGNARTSAEMYCATIRACIVPSDIQPNDHAFAIADLPEIVSLASVAPTYNVSLLQRSQLEWFFFVARHFCDALEETAWTASPPAQYPTMPCTVEGCAGTMTHNPGVETAGVAVIEPQQGWVCDRDASHVKLGPVVEAAPYAPSEEIVLLAAEEPADFTDEPEKGSA